MNNDFLEELDNELTQISKTTVFPKETEKQKDSINK